MKASPVERAKRRLLEAIKVEPTQDWLPPSIRSDRALLMSIAAAAASLPDLYLWRALPSESQSIIRDALRFEGVDINDLDTRTP